MGLVLYLFAIAAGAAIVWFRWGRRSSSRNETTPESLVAQLRPASCLPEWSAIGTPEECWQQVNGAQGLYAIYQNARVMLAMADYASCHGEDVDAELLAALRSDVLQIRMLVVRALSHYALHRLNHGIGISALRAATIYREMTARMGALLDGNAGMAAPAGAR